MKRQRLLSRHRWLIAGLVLMVAGCSTTKEPEAMDAEVLKPIRDKYAPDRRLAVFAVTLEQQGDTLVVAGDVGEPAAKREVLDLVARLHAGPVADRITVLPDAALGTRTHGIVRVSVGNMRRKPDHASEMVTQILMGTTVRVLKQEGGWFFIQGPDRYLGWIDDDAVVETDEAGIEAWRGSGKVIVTDYFGIVREAPSASALPVCDVVAGNLLRSRGTRGAWASVELADGRRGYLERGLVQDFASWKRSRKATPENVERVAKMFLGVPYLWGGTSAKGFDCSGYTKTVFLLNGTDLTRDANQQSLLGEDVPSGEGFRSLRKGDLLFFGRKEKDDEPERIWHVGIYLGNQEFIHCAGRVRINSLNPEAPHFDRGRLNSFVRARRLIGAPEVKEIGQSGR